MGEFFVFKFAYAFFFLIGLFFIENGKTVSTKKLPSLLIFLIAVLAIMTARQKLKN